ncbi:MAG: tetratricopeptide repeat protein [Candidatus Marinimicrobia bacterium]|nr:tetratricopeptide repeat protein [Candidatus Neomarinimicrobiota bacterium]
MNVQKLLIILLLIFGFNSCSDRDDSNKIYRIGIDSVKEIAFFENHYDSYITWIEKKPTSKTVIHFDSHIDIAPMTSTELEKIVSAVDKDEVEPFIQHPYSYYIPDKKFLTVANWLYPAMRGGIVNTLIWVVPDDILSLFWLNDLKVRFRNYFNDLTENDIETFHLQGSIIKGIMYGVEVIITPIADIPRIDSPVLLDFDIDYYNFNSALELSRLSKPKHYPMETINILKNKNIIAEVVTISTSVPNGYTSLSIAYLAEDLNHLLKFGIDIPADYKIRLQYGEMGDSSMAVGNYDEAIQHYKSSLDEDNPNAGILFNLSVAEEKASLSSSSNDYFIKAVKLNKAFDNPLKNELNTSFYDKDYANVKTIINQLNISNTVITPWMKYKFASALFSLDEYKLAKDEFKNLLDEGYNVADIYRMLGHINIYEGDVKTGIDLYKQSLKHGGENTFVLIELCRLHRLQKDISKADSYLVRASKSNPHSSFVHNEAGWLAVAKGNYILAEKEYLEAIRLLPSNLTARYTLARIYQKLGKLSAAENSYIEYLRFNNRDVRVIQDLGLLMANQGKLKEAIKYLEQAVMLQPDLARAHGNLGVLFLQLGQYSKAKEEFLNVVELEPNDAFGWYNLALSELIFGNQSEAINNLTIAIAKGGQKFLEMAKNDKNLSSIYSELLESSQK